MPVQPAVFGTEPVWSVNGTDLGPGISADLFPAGDLNGDGRTDVISYNADTKEGLVYYGEEDGFSIPPQVVPLSGGLLIYPLGDVNGDGFDDLQQYHPTLGWHFYPGSAQGVSLESIEPPGFSGVDVGDINGDGYGDLLGEGGFEQPITAECEGVTYEILGAGKLELFLGGPAGPSTTSSWLLEGQRENEDLRQLRSPSRYYEHSPGDFDGDGYDDILVRSLRGEDTGLNSGCGTGDPDPFGPWDVPGTRIEVYAGGPSGVGTEPAAVLQVYDDSIGELMRLDFNGDGRQDLLHWLPDDDVPTRVRIQRWLSTSEGVNMDLNAPVVELINTAPLGIYKPEVRVVGDVTGDGRDDLAVAGHYNKVGGDETETPGRTWIYASSDNGFDPVWYRDGDETNTSFGSSGVYGVKDLNNDGVRDLLIISGPVEVSFNAMLFHSGGPPIVDDDPGGTGGSEETGGDPDAGDDGLDAGDATAGDADGTGGSAGGDGDGDGCACDARSPHNPAAPRSLAAVLLLAGLSLRRRSSRRRQSSQVPPNAWTS